MLDDIKSHTLIDEDVYREFYQHIKAEFGRDLVKSWTERTDPQKYVYEDCGIAAYILSLRKALDLKIEFFADFACGNGLLAYLLSANGLKGFGFDARKRKIWQRFGDTADLRQMTLNPTDPNGAELPPQTDFIIGNHSDELIPWIPVLAARRKINFFILPCCLHNFFCRFDGKAARQVGGRGKYEQYLDYVESICRRLGFELRTDRLKISSAKKIAFLGTIPTGGLPENVEEIIGQLLREASIARSEFKPIPAVQPIKNCTRIPLDFRKRLTKKLAFFLLGLSNDHVNGWKCGGKIHLSELSDQLLDEEKAEMKAQDGGLQTFLRNVHQLFHVEKGTVHIRRWPEVYTRHAKAGRQRQCRCWFDENHPQGCPLDASVCPYRHEVK